MVGGHDRHDRVGGVDRNATHVHQPTADPVGHKVGLDTVAELAIERLDGPPGPTPLTPERVGEALTSASRLVVGAAMMFASWRADSSAWGLILVQWMERMMIRPALPCLIGTPGRDFSRLGQRPMKLQTSVPLNRSWP